MNQDLNDERDPEMLDEYDFSGSDRIKRSTEDERGFAESRSWMLHPLATAPGSVPDSRRESDVWQSFRRKSGLVSAVVGRAGIEIVMSDSRGSDRIWREVKR